MKKIIVLLLILVLLPCLSYSQGDNEWDASGTAPIEGMAPTSITNYNHTKANVTVSFDSTVSRFCVYCTKALKFYLNAATGDYRTIPASTEYCRTVRKGVTAAVFGGASSATTRIEVERQY